MPTWTAPRLPPPANTKAVGPEVDRPDEDEVTRSPTNGASRRAPLGGTYSSGRKYGATGAAVVPASAAPLGVANGSLEKVTKGVPDCFSRTGAGRARVAWGLTRSAHTGKVAATVSLTQFSRGAFGLIPSLNTACAPAVLPGATYRLSVAYLGTTSKNVLRVYRHSGAGWTTWGDFAVVGRSKGWTSAGVVTPKVPTGTDRISFGLLAAAGGTLVTDDYGLKMASRPAVDRFRTIWLSANNVGRERCHSSCPGGAAH